jgi:DNA primase
MLYELIKNRVQVSEVASKKTDLKKRGTDYIGLCPFHSEKTPSFAVNDFKRFFYCFGCHVGGDVISFISQTTGLSYKEAALKLASDYKIEIPSSAAVRQELDEFDKIHSTLEAALEFYRKNLTLEGIKYLNNRGISQDIINKFEIGYAPAHNSMRKNLEAKGIPLLMLDKAGLIAKKDQSLYEVFRDRIIFPIRNSHNKIIAFGGRTLKDIQPKYLNSPETLLFKKNEVFYGENFAYTSCYKNNRSIVVEGYMDLIKMYTNGFTETVATLGTAVNEKHFEKLWSLVDEIIMCMDGDAAGIRASKKVIEIALPRLKANKYISFVILPQGSDPDDVLTNKGTAYMEMLIQNRLELSKMIWSFETSNVDTSSPELIARLEAKLQEYTRHIKDDIVVKNYKRFFNDQLWSLSRNKKSKNQTSSIVAKPTNNIPNNILEISLLAILIKYSELLDDIQIIEKINQLEFSANYSKFLNANQIKLLESEIVPIVQKTNPSFFTGLKKTDPKQAFLKLAKQLQLISLENKYKQLAQSDPKKFLEFYNSYKTEMDKLLSDI